MKKCIDITLLLHKINIKRVSISSKQWMENILPKYHDALNEVENRRKY